MSDGKALVDYYEDVRENYTEALQKSSVFEKRELSKYIEKLRSVKITVLDPKELIRIVFYLDDMIEHHELQENTDITTWLPENMLRNPKFFSRYFKQSKTLALKKEEPKQEFQEEKRHIIPDLQNSDEETVKKIWEQPVDNIVTLPNTIDGVEPVELTEDLTIQNDQSENSELEDYPLGDYLINSNLTDLVVQIQEQRKNEMTAQLQKMIETVVGINFYDKPSLIAQLAESTACRQLVIGIFSELNIRSPVTSVTEKEVQETQLIFNPNYNYSIKELKRGFAHAAIEINKLKSFEKTNIDLDSRVKALERSRLSLTAELSLLRAKLSDAENKEITQIKQQNQIKQKILYCYIVWDEKNEDNQIRTIYLGTQDKSKISETGFYLTKYLIKTDRPNGLRFRTVKQAQNQLDRVIKNYKHINTKSKISLKGHLKQARLILLVEQEEFL